MKAEWIRFYFFVFLCHALALVAGFFMFHTIDVHFQSLVYYSAVEGFKLSPASRLFVGIIANEYGSYTSEVYSIFSASFLAWFILKSLPKTDLHVVKYFFVQAFILFLCISIAAYSLFHCVVFTSGFGDVFIPMGAPDDAQSPLVSYFLKPAWIIILITLVFATVQLFAKIIKIPNQASEATSGSAPSAPPEAPQG